MTTLSRLVQNVGGSVDSLYGKKKKEHRPERHRTVAKQASIDIPGKMGSIQPSERHQQKMSRGKKVSIQPYIAKITGERHERRR